MYNSAFLAGGSISVSRPQEVIFEHAFTARRPLFVRLSAGSFWSESISVGAIQSMLFKSRNSGHGTGEVEEECAVGGQTTA